MVFPTKTCNWLSKKKKVVQDNSRLFNIPEENLLPEYMRALRLAV
jgi:hypothetical protein